MNRTVLRRGLLVTLLLPIAVVAPARADVPARTLSGVVYLPDGVTPAAAAAIDVSIADRATHLPLTAPYARSVSAADGTYTLDLTPTDLVTPALETMPAGTAVSVRLAVADLAPAPGPSATFSGVVLYLDGTISRSSAPGSVGGIAIYVSDPTRRATSIVTSVEQQAVRGVSPLAVFGDPDLVAGHENVNDPDLVPPLGSHLAVVPMNDVMATYDSVPTPTSPLPDSRPCHDAQVRSSDTGYVGVRISRVKGAICDKREDEGNGTGNPCTLARVEWFPEDGDNQPVDGVKMSATIKFYHCTNETDETFDYWGVAMEGWARALGDNSSDPAKSVELWRYKFRIEAPEWASAYRYLEVNPKQDVKDGGHPVRWTVGIAASGPTATIGSEYTPGSPGWMHPWPEDTDRQLYHVSWIAHNKWGASGSAFWTGGGATYRVPKDTDIDAFTSIIKRDVMLWRCWMKHTTREYQWYCDPR